MPQIAFWVDWSLAHIQAENLKNVQKCVFGKKFQESMGEMGFEIDINLEWFRGISKPKKLWSLLAID